MRALVAATIIMGVLIIIGTSVLVYELVRRSSDQFAGDEKNQAIALSTPTAQASAAESLIDKAERIVNIYAQENYLVIHTKGPDQRESLIGIEPKRGHVKYRLQLKE